MGQAQLRHLAQRAVRIVWRLPGSRLAVLTGSVATGYADLTSDIDISLFGVKLAPVDVRRSLIAATSSAPTDITQFTQKTYASDAFWLQDRAAGGGLHLIDVRYFLIEEAQRLIAHPFPQSLAEHELLAHLSTADVLVDYEFRGPELIRDLQRATREARSERLARASADLHRALDRLQIVSESTTIFYATTDAILAFFQLLAARNDRWILFPKWSAAWLSGLEYVPADVHRRLSAVALLPSRPEHVADKLETLRALESEVMAL
jgi:hypothetical protein